MSNSMRPPWTVVCQDSPSFTFSQSLLKSLSIDLVMSLTISSSACPFSFWFQPFPSSRSFLKSQFFTWGDQSIGASASASVLPINIHGLFPLWLTGLISLRSKLQESSPVPQFKSINSSALSLLYGPTLTSFHDYWKNHRFDCMNLCRQRCWHHMSLLFHKLSRFVIAFLPRSKYVLILWLPSPCSDYGTQENKICHCS